MSKQAEYSRRKQSEIAECGPIPAIVDPERRARCEKNLELFLTTYFPHSTGLKPFSAKHQSAISRIERAALVGGYFLFVVFRGFGKSTITENSTLWATLYGHSKFIVPIGSDKGSAAMILDSIKAEIETNDLLYEDFPEVCHLVRALEGKVQRTHSQTVNGLPTHITWRATDVVLPTIAGSPASAAVIKPRGITANLRGMRHKTPDGMQQRPDFVLLDDPQTDESARSPDQVETRLGILNKAILRLGGHDRRIAAVCTATVIQPDDMVDRLADREKYPAWQTERVPMLEAFADAHESFWLGEYADLRNAYNPDVPGDQERAHAEATEHYRQNRATADAGAVATWEHCFDDNELSAVQHAYNILIDTGLESFMSECQNTPLVEANAIDALTAAQIDAKRNGYARGVVPSACSKVTGFIDVQGKLLYWVLCAWEPDFTGYVLDYGVFPEQKRSRFTLRDAGRTLRRVYKGTDDEGAIFAGLTDCVKMLCGQEFVRVDGGIMRLSRMLVDANWGKTSALVTSCLQQSAYAPILTPAYGRGVKATHKPISQWQQSKTSKGAGPEWVPTQTQGGKLAGVLYDTNYWKQRFHGGLGLPLGSKGCISLPKGGVAEHRMLADHVDAETAKLVEVDGRKVFEFQATPNRDNHFFDGVVGNMVAASICGITNVTVRSKRRPKRQRFRRLE